MHPASVLLLVPFTYLAAALVPARFARSTRERFSVALVAAGAALVATLAGGFAMGLAGPGVARVTVLPAIGGLSGLTLSTRADALTLALLVLVTTIAGIILRFSRRYLAAEAGTPRYLRAFLAVMAAVSLLIVTNDVLVLALCWTGTSLALHQLLTFFPDRPAALVAAHKKFLMSRLADAAIYGAVGLFWTTLDTRELDVMAMRAAVLPSVPASLHVAGLLLVLGVLLRSAQLPFHGWLIQVMEAPTPVSALLHAGVVNIGGFVMIRLGEVMVRLAPAQGVLVVVGTTTAVVAALVMTTRVSIKVALAWSTCAQMGFMLLECGLGAYRLALLHLLAHSVYKAHAFLSSGRAVERWVERGLTVAPRRATAAAWVTGGLGAGLTVAAVTSLAGLHPDLATTASLAVLSLSLGALYSRTLASRGVREAFVLAVAGAGLCAVHAIWHAVFTAVLPAPETPPGALRVGWVVGSFVLLYVVEATVTTAPQGRLARRLFPGAYAGFYLDELFTRMTFRLWPPRAASPEVRPSTAPATVEGVS